jgi:hypothetical protein
MGEILRADETQLVLLANVMQRSGLLQLSDEPKAPQVRAQKSAQRSRWR